MKRNKNKIIDIEIDKSLNRNNDWVEENFKNLDSIKKEKFKERVNNKGWYVYDRILKYLINKKVDFVNDEHKYNLVSSIYVYDKRIRQLLYKFTSLIEEKYRAMIFRNIKKERYGLAIQELTFGGLIKKIRSSNLVSYEEINNLKIVHKLRNDVYHHRLLIVDDKENKHNSLSVYIQSIYSLLWNDVLKKELVKEIKKELTKSLNDKYEQEFSLLSLDKIEEINELTKLEILTGAKKIVIDQKPELFFSKFEKENNNYFFTLTSQILNHLNSYKKLPMFYEEYFPWLMEMNIKNEITNKFFNEIKNFFWIYFCNYMREYSDFIYKFVSKDQTINYVYKDVFECISKTKFIKEFLGSKSYSALSWPLHNYSKISFNNKKILKIEKIFKNNFNPAFSIDMEKIKKEFQNIYDKFVKVDQKLADEYGIEMQPDLRNIETTEFTIPHDNIFFEFLKILKHKS